MIVCVVHGLPFGEHVCLYCAICYHDLTPEECVVDADGVKWDVCWRCHWDEEEELMRRAYAAYLV